jgi:hypothetical protein
LIIDLGSGIHVVVASARLADRNDTMRKVIPMEMLIVQHEVVRENPDAGRGMIDESIS